MQAEITLRQAAQQALEALESVYPYTDSLICYASTTGEHPPNAIDGNVRDAINALRTALAEREQEPVAWMHNLIADNIITHCPFDLERHPERWTALYSNPKPCPTCEALSRTVMMDQTSHDTAPTPRKPLTDEEICHVVRYEAVGTSNLDIARAIERAHGIGGEA